MTDNVNVLNFNGKAYKIDDFSDGIRNLIEIRNRWNHEASTQRLDLAKTEAAIKTVDSELTTLVGAEVEKLTPVE